MAGGISVGAGDALVGVVFVGGGAPMSVETCRGVCLWVWARVCVLECV